MAFVKVQVHGGRQFRRELRILGGAFPKAMAEVHHKAADIVAKEGERNARAFQRTGRLADSIKSRKRTASAAVSAGTNVRVPYAGVIEFGWEEHGIEPNSYMYKALNDTEDEFLDEYMKMVDALTLRAFPMGVPSGVSGIST